MSLFWFGVGQLYNGEGRKAVKIFAAWAFLVCAVIGLMIVVTPTPAAVVVLLLLALLIIGLDVYAAVDAFRQARRLHAVALKRYQRAWVYLLVAVVIILASNGLPKLVMWLPFSVPSASMIPTAEPGEYVFTRLYFRDEAPRRGDLATFHYARDRKFDYFKRIIGLPGDRIQLRSGKVYINGAPLTREPVENALPSHLVGVGAKQYVEITPEGRRYRIVKLSDAGEWNNTTEAIVPADHYFVLGDNRDNSADSRQPDVGFVAREDMISRASVVYWSPSPNRIGTRLE